MVSAPRAPSVKLLPGAPQAGEAFGRWQSAPVKLNETGTRASQRVHLREIVVISTPGRRRALRLIACRSPSAPI
jgi:hypothetical protein